MAVPSAKTQFRMPVIQMNCFVKARAATKYANDVTNATISTKTKRIRVLVLSEKSFAPV